MNPRSGSSEKSMSHEVRTLTHTQLLGLAHVGDVRFERTPIGRELVLRNAEECCKGFGLSVVISSLFGSQGWKDRLVGQYGAVNECGVALLPSTALFRRLGCNSAATWDGRSIRA